MSPGPTSANVSRGDGVEALEPDRELELASGPDAEAFDVSGREVELDVPEAIDDQHVRDDLVRPDPGHGQVDPDERRRIDGRPELARVDAGSKVRSRGREDVAPVKRARERLEAEPGIGDLPRRDDAARPLGGGHEQAVVRPDEQPAVARLHDNRLSLRPDPGSTTARCTPSGMYGQRVREHERALQHLVRLDRRA